jgi:tetratricopeptide (TPR) repeat protein
LNGAVALFEQLRLNRGVIEGQIALAFCYHRQGLFDMARTTLIRVLDDLSDEIRTRDLHGLTLMRLGSLERQAGHLNDALSALVQASGVAETSGPWLAARTYLELATTYTDLALSEESEEYAEQSRDFQLRTMHQCSAIGHHRYIAVAENNAGMFMLNQKRYEESEANLIRAQNSFHALSDSHRGALSNEALGRLYIETKQYLRAKEVIEQTISILEIADGEAFLAEALTTKAIVCSKLEKFNEAQRGFEAAYQIYERCRDDEGAGLALLIMLEELGDRLEHSETVQLAEKLKKLIGNTQQRRLRTRAEICMSKYIKT